MKNPIHHDVSRFGELDIYYFKEGSHVRLYRCLGAHLYERDGKTGTLFAVWAPNAKAVTVRGDFNAYDISYNFV